MDNWSSDESDFTEQIAMMAMMGMQQVVQILQEEGVVNSQPRTRQPISRDRVDANNRLVEHYFAPNCVYPPSVFRRKRVNLCYFQSFFLSFRWIIGLMMKAISQNKLP